MFILLGSFYENQDSQANITLHVNYISIIKKVEKIENLLVAGYRWTMSESRNKHFCNNQMDHTYDNS